ncbi:MAG: glucosaminidase domain-containing protein [Bacteroidales bacterium]
MNNALTVYSELKALGMSDNIAKYATAQAGHETGGFTSAIFKENNNCFGMNYEGQVNAKGEKNGYAYYDRISDSVSDWLAWYVRNRNKLLSLPLFITSLESFVSFLKNNDYFTDTEANYLAGCQYYYKQYFG